MSKESVQAIHDAVARHLAEREPDAIVTDWFVAYGSMSHDPDDDGSHDNIMHGIHYTTSTGSPQGVLGIATLGLGSLHDDLAPGGDE